MLAAGCWLFFIHLFNLVMVHFVHSPALSNFTRCTRFIAFIKMFALIDSTLFLSSLLLYTFSHISLSVSLPFFPLFPLFSGKHQHRWSGELLGETHHCQWEWHAPVWSPRHNHPPVREGQRRDMLLLLQIPVTAPDSWTSFCISLYTKSSLSVSEREGELLFLFFRKNVWVPTLFRFKGGSGGRVSEGGRERAS